MTWFQWEAVVCEIENTQRSAMPMQQSWIFNLFGVQSRVGYFKSGNSRSSPTSHFSDAMWEMGCKHSQSPLPFTSQVGCGKISRPNILYLDVGSLKVGSRTQMRIPIFKISASGRRKKSHKQLSPPRQFRFRLLRNFWAMLMVGLDSRENKEGQISVGLWYGNAVRLEVNFMTGCHNMWQISR